MILKRNAFTLHIDDTAYTFMMPLSAEHNGKLLKIYEDAYGDMNTCFMSIQEIIDLYKNHNESVLELIHSLHETF